MDDSYESFIDKIGGFEDALKQEWEVAQNSNDTDTIRSLIEKKIACALPGFVDDLILIARAGDTDSSRLKAISFAFNWYFKESASAKDEFSMLLSDLTNLPTAVRTTTEPPPTPEPTPDPEPEPTTPE